MARETTLFIISAAISVPLFFVLLAAIPYGRRGYSVFFRILNTVLAFLIGGLVFLRYVRELAIFLWGGTYIDILTVAEAIIAPFYGCLLGAHIWMNRHYFLSPFWIGVRDRTIKLILFR